MNLEALPKYYSPKSPKLSDDASATGSGGLTITDVMAAQGMVQSKAPLGFALFLAKVGVQDPQFAIEGLLNYAMALDNPTLNKLSEETRLQIIPYLVNFALLIIPGLRQVRLAVSIVLVLDFIMYCAKW